MFSIRIQFQLHFCHPKSDNQFDQTILHLKQFNFPKQKIKLIQSNQSLILTQFNKILYSL